MRSNRWILGAALLAILPLTGCAEVTEAKHEAVEPYTKQETATSGLYRVTLTEDTSRRLDVKTKPVEEARARSGALRKVIPYAGVIYDLNGATFAYTSPEALSYVREPIRIDYIEKGIVYMLEGPKIGTPVVVAGAAELYGIEFGLGK